MTEPQKEFLAGGAPGASHPSPFVWGHGLLDDAFSVDQLEATCARDALASCISSHGRCTGCSGVVFAHGPGRLTMTQLAQMWAPALSRPTARSVDLHACETAQGNDRAALGWPGWRFTRVPAVPWQRLWQVSDEASAALIRPFTGICTSPRLPGPGAATGAGEAAGHELFADPFFWAPFLLINNWL